MSRVAILSVHSHADRTFLDDRTLALVSGDLAADGVDNDLIAAFLDAGSEALEETEAFVALAGALEAYDVVIYERVWSPRVIEALRARHPGARFVSCEGEHVLADPPADFVCRGRLRASVPALLRHLRDASPLPRDVLARVDGEWREGLAKRAEPPTVFRPNLRPVVIGSSTWARERTFSIEGNAGCPYRTDARDNPLYEGAVIPEGYGRGCAFCTTGNHSEAAPAEVTREKVLAQLRFVRAEAPERTRLVLKDQNPFGWLTEVVEACVEEGLGGFALLLETRADWFLKNQRRFERALELAARASIRLCPFLIGIESFSDAELARYNKGTTAADNERFLATIDAWAEKYPALDLSHAAFGFVLLSPWTTLADLRANLEGIERTRFDRWRGHLLVSRARLYPDTALYYLAERDGLLVDRHASGADDASQRYGYFPYAPWRFADPHAARFAELGAALTEAHGGKDQARLFRALLECLEAASDPRAVTLETVRERLEGPSARPDPSATRERLARLVRPLELDAPFGDGWTFGAIDVRPGVLTVSLEHRAEGRVALEIVPRSGGPAFARSKHYALRHEGRALSEAQERALRAVCAAIAANDR